MLLWNVLHWFNHALLTRTVEVEAHCAFNCPETIDMGKVLNFIGSTGEVHPGHVKRLGPQQYLNSW